MGAWDLDVSWHEQGVRVRRDRANGILHGFLRVAPFKMFGSSHLVACERNRPNYMNMVQACVFTIQRLMRGAQHGSAQCRRISTHSLREATTGASQWIRPRMPQRRGDGFSATFDRKVSVGKISSDQRVGLGYSFRILKQRVLIDAERSFSEAASLQPKLWAAVMRIAAATSPRR